MTEAAADDWPTEYLDLVMAVKVVGSIEEAIAHVRHFGSGHTEAIVTRDLMNADRFVRELDSAVVVVNAATRFTDGEEFGYGAEIGISTQKLHVRGPMGLEALTCERWVVHGNGQVRG
jgi:glutamate-5-semialdehyde dehydrogenase